MGTVPGCWGHSWSLGTLPWVVPVVSAPSEMRCTQSSDRWQGGEETGAVAAGEFPKVPQRVVFFLGKIPLLNPVAPSLQGRACPLTQPTSPARPGAVRVRIACSPTFNSPQPVPTVSLGFPLRPDSPPCDFRQPGLSQCCSGLVWQGTEPLTRLSPRSPAAGPAREGLGLQLPWSPRWSQGPFCPEAIPLPSVFSVSSVLFGLSSL